MRNCQAKIVATLGPASWAAETIETLIREGVDAFRLNYSHAPEDGYRAVAARVREAADRAGRPVALIADLAGPKIRTGELPCGGIPLEVGATVRFRGVDATEEAESGEGDGTVVPISYADLAHDVRVGQSVLLADGAMEVRVTDVDEGIVVAEVVRGGRLGSRKGVNLPETDLRLRVPTPKDERDLAAVREIGADFLAISFVRSAADLRAIRAAVGEPAIPLIAKIEKPQAVDGINEIFDETDGIMVARGDLGVEMSLARVPIVQKRLLAGAWRRGLWSITATQMLETMTNSLVPTRAEAADIANAVLDGSGALMLSGETAIGRYPVEAVRTMNEIIRVSEVEIDDRATASWEGDTPTEAVAHAACDAAADLRARAIVAFTLSGRTAMLVSHRRPRCPIYAFSPEPSVRRRLALAWGVEPLECPLMSQTDRLIGEADRRLCSAGLAAPGDTVILVSGTSPLPGATNVMMARVIPSSCDGEH